MEINVKGLGEKKYRPDQIVLNINITNVYENYEKAVNNGEESVLCFLNKMKQFDLTFEDFKTVRYNIKDELKYCGHQNKKVGVRYERVLQLIMDFNIQKMSNIIEVSSKIKNAPCIDIKYGLKDTRTAEMELFADAYFNAKKQADLIANAAGLTVVKCIKTNVEDTCDNYYRSASYQGAVMCESCSRASDIIAKTYFPEDIFVEQEIYCVFVAE